MRCRKEIEMSRKDFIAGYMAGAKARRANGSVTRIAVEQIVEWNPRMEYYEGMYGDDVCMLGGYTPSGREVAIEWDPGFDPETVTISIDGMPVADVFNNSTMELTDEAFQKAKDTANVEAFIIEHDLHPQRDYWGNPILGAKNKTVS